VSGGLSVIGAILAIIGTGIVVALAIYWAIRLYTDFEGFIASKLAEDAGYDFAEGDTFPHPIVRPDDLSVRADH
jgi:hypothetical protein